MRISARTARTSRPVSTGLARPQHHRPRPAQPEQRRHAHHEVDERRQSAIAAVALAHEQEDRQTKRKLHARPDEHQAHEP
ncbi:MAG: hypothetical protein ACK56I_13675, partial [bacterium]